MPNNELAENDKIASSIQQNVSFKLNLTKELDLDVVKAELVVEVLDEVLVVELALAVIVFVKLPLVVFVAVELALAAVLPQERWISV